MGERWKRAGACFSFSTTQGELRRAGLVDGDEEALLQVWRLECAQLVLEPRRSIK